MARIESLDGVGTSDEKEEIFGWSEGFGREFRSSVQGRDRLWGCGRGRCCDRFYGGTALAGPSLGLCYPMIPPDGRALGVNCARMVRRPRPTWQC